MANRPGQSGSANVQHRKEEREQRLASELRANLLKRKAQQRARTGAEPSNSVQTPSHSIAPESEEK